MKTKLSNVSSKYGAPMGRQNTLPNNFNPINKLHLEQLKWVDNDYDEGGAYWGNNGKDFIFRASTKTKTEIVELFTRAINIDKAKKNFIKITSLPLQFV